MGVTLLSGFRVMTGGDSVIFALQPPKGELRAIGRVPGFGILLVLFLLEKRMEKNSRLGLMNAEMCHMFLMGIFTVLNLCCR